MSAVPVLRRLSPARRLADSAHSWALRLALGAGAFVAIGALLARRVDLSTLGDADIVWAWIALSLVLNLASVGGKAIVWKAALDALPGHRAVRYGHVVPALFIGFLLNTVLFARIGELARVAVLARRQRLAGDGISASTIAGTALAEQLVLGVALALSVVALAPVLHLPHMIWQLVIVFLAVLAVASAGLMVAMRKALRAPRRSGLWPLAGSGAVPQPRATAVAGRYDLLGRADRRHLGGARGLPHPRRPGRRGPRLRLVDDRAAVPVLARQPRHLPARRRLGPLVSPSAATLPDRERGGLQRRGFSSSRACGVGLGLVFLAREGLRQMVPARPRRCATTTPPQSACGRDRKVGVRPQRCDPNVAVRSAHGQA